MIWLRRLGPFGGAPIASFCLATRALFRLSRSWPKTAYNAFDIERKTMGVMGHGVYQADGNPSNVTVYHHFDNMDAAKAFVASDRLKEVMESGGVVGTPDIWLTNQA